MAKKIYFGVPVAEPTGQEVSITHNNIAEHFDVTHGSYPSDWTLYYDNYGFSDGTADGKFYDGLVYEFGSAGTKLVAKYDMYVSFAYGYTSGNGSKTDTFEVTVKGERLPLTKATSAEETYSGYLAAGDTIYFCMYRQYTSISAYFEAMTVTATSTSTNTTSVAREVKKMYYGAGTLTFTEVEYIESSGTQYIDTGFTPNQDTKVEADIYVNSVENQYADAVFGVRTSSSSKCFYSFVEGTNVTTEHWLSGYNTGAVTGTLTSRTGRHTVIKDKNTETVDGVVMTSTAGTFSCDYPMYIFNVNQAGTPASDKYAHMKLYSLSIYDNGTLVREYAPVKRSDGAYGLYDKVNGKFYGNAGSGVFAAGAEGSILKTTGIARKIKKAYIGVGGIARLFFGGGKPAYYGTATSLSSARYFLAGASVGNYALFAGGYNGSYLTTVDAYDANLTRTSPTTLSSSRAYLAGASVGNYALFAGGYTSNAYRTTVDAYDAGLTRSTATALQEGRGQLASATVGNYALFGGGRRSTAGVSSVVDAYDASLTRSTPTALSAARRNLAATTVGNYALFGGGEQNGTDSQFFVVDAYDAGLTRSAPASLSNKAALLSAATTGNYALFAGGNYAEDDGDGGYDSVYPKTVDAYDTSLTKSSAASLGRSFYDGAAVSIDGYALFGGGTTAVVDAYDTSLTRNSSLSLSAFRRRLAAATVGNYALFGGGATGSNSSSTARQSTVDVFAVV